MLKRKAVLVGGGYLIPIRIGINAVIAFSDVQSLWANRLKRQDA
jgi:hypothetical protein